MASLVSSIAVGPNENTADRLEKIKREHEHLNHYECEVLIKIIRETTEGCAPGTKQVYYSLDLIPKED